MAITFDNKELNSQSRIEIVNSIKRMADEYSKRNNTTVHLSGMPYIRTAITGKVVDEMKLFLGLAILITALVLMRDGKSADEAIALIKERRSPYVLSNSHFVKYLEERGSGDS
jgi:predicted RND superfamily exporter protein